MPRANRKSKRDSALLNISEKLMKKIEQDRSFYLPFGPISNTFKRDDKVYHHQRSYANYLSQMKAKDEFDAYKIFYRLNVKRLCMREAYSHVSKLRPISDKNIGFMYLAMDEFLKQRFTQSFGWFNHNTWRILMGMMHTRYHAMQYWGGMYGFSRTMVESFSNELKLNTWRAAIKTLTNKGIVEPSPDVDLLKAYLKSMANQSKHPVLTKILREQMYVFTSDGNRMVDTILRDQLEFIDRVQHNNDWFRKANLPNEMKANWKKVKKKLYGKTMPNKQEINKRKNKLINDGTI
jgi:hypothetical protein